MSCKNLENSGMGADGRFSANNPNAGDPKHDDSDDDSKYGVRQQRHGMRYFPNIAENLPTYDPVEGAIDMEDYVEQMENNGILYNWDDIALIHFTLSGLRGNAKLWKNSVAKEQRDWENWKTLLVENFPNVRSEIDLVLEAQNYSRSPNQNITDYYYKKLSLVNKAGFPDHTHVSWIVRGLNSIDYMTYLGPISRYGSPPELLQHLVSASSFLDKKPERKYDKRVHVGNLNSNKSADIKCFKCKVMGHYASKCPNAKRGACFICQSIEHMASNCPKRREQAGQKSNYPASTIKPSAVVHINNKCDINTHAKYFKDGWLDGHPVRCYVDLGSGYTLLKKSLADRFQIIYNASDVTKVKGYGGGFVNVMGCAKCTLEIDGVRAENMVIYIVPDKVQIIELLVGHQFTERDDIRIISDSSGLMISKVDNDAVTPRVKGTVWAKNAVVIPKNFVAHIAINCQLKNEEVCIEGSIRKSGEVIPRCLVRTNEHGDAILPILNLSDGDLKLEENELITRGETCIPSEEQLGPIEKNEEPIQMDEILTELEGEDASRLHEMLNDHRNLIARNLKQVGLTNLTSFKIDLVSDKPVYYRPYRLAPIEREKVKEIIEELKEADIIEDSISPFASPIVLVRKKSGQIRMCVDYRALNRISKKDHFPLPLIDDQLDRLRDHRYFTSLDLHSGYYQIPVAKETRPLTAIVTPDGHYQFKRMTFGFSNSPAVFQRLINQILGNFRYSIAMAYLDDIIIPCRTVEEGFSNVKTILDLIQKSGLTLNLSKCKFFFKKIEYLGFEISFNSIEPGSSKVKAVQSFPTPKDIRAVRSFYGLSSYFRRFIQNFATVARPLSDLLGKNVQFVWGSEQETAFNLIKRVLTEKPVLAIFNPNAETEIHTDASALGVAAVLYQRQKNGSLKPICYYSRKTSKEESRYSAIELEALAIVVGLEKFRIYLLGKQFVIRTDCNSLKLLANKRDLNPRIARWFLRIAEFDYKIEYVQGKINLVADALSRNPSNEPEWLDSDDRTVLGIEDATDWVAAMQRGDTNILSIRDELEKGNSEIHEKFTMYKCRVYKITKGRWRLYAPEELVYDLVRDAHESVCHMGIDKTLSKLKENFYFPKMREVVAEYTNRCLKCLYFKKQTGKKPGFLHPLDKGDRPFVTVHLDHVGPYPTSTKGNRFVAALIDAFSKYVVLYAVPDVGVESTLELVFNFISHYGKPVRIITDRGAAFISGKFKEFCVTHDIIHSKIASACARANGQVERVNQIITTSLSILSEEENRDWDKKLVEVQFAINNAEHRITKTTPSRIIFRYEGRHLNQNQLIDEIIVANEENGMELEVPDVESLLKKNKEVMSKQFNKNRRSAPKLNAKDLVMVKRDAPATGESRKLTCEYCGPYEIVKYIGNDRYLVQDIEGEQQSGRIYKGILSIDRLKLVKRVTPAEEEKKID